MTNQKDGKPTRAEKITAVKNLIRGLLEKTNYKHNELIDEASRLYAEAFGGEENPNDIKGRIGSILDVMKKDGEVVYEGGVYALKREETPEKPVETKKKQTRTRAKKTETEETEKVEKTVKKRATKKAKAEEKNPLPPPPLQPIAPVDPVTPEVAPEPIPAEKPKKRGRKAKTAEQPKAEVVQTEETVEQKEEPAKAVEPPKAEVEEIKKEETAQKPVQKEEAQSPKGTLMDMSFLFGEVKKTKKEEPKAEVKQPQKAEEKPKAEEKVEPIKTEKKPLPKAEVKPAPVAEKKPEPKNRKNGKGNEKKPTRSLTAEEKLQEAFLTKLRRLGGEYFEYYSVYLLERYSRMNGRRLEALRITGGDHDGGIDGEIELTDRLGFRETIYIQSKNWNPDKGDEKLWVVGETLLQQFIGACVCRQAKDGKQHCRGIFMTTSRFTAEARRILDETSDKYVGYDGTDVFEAAKECQFGVIKNNGEWALDEELLSGEKSFFRMF